jgi:hypothetical protein
VETDDDEERAWIDELYWRGWSDVDISRWVGVDFVSVRRMLRARRQADYRRRKNARRRREYEQRVGKLERRYHCGWCGGRGHQERTCELAEVGTRKLVSMPIPPPEARP